jgi:polar amino acid transport system permease protein
VLHGLITTIVLAGVTFAVSLLPALFVAVGRTYGPSPLKAVMAVFVILVRSVPAVVMVVFVFFALPFAGIYFGKYTAIVVTLALLQTAYVSEVFRGALLSIGRAQFEAGYACGLGTVDVFRLVVLPQAAVVAAPAFANSVVQLVQNTTIASVVAVGDLIGTALNVQTNTGNPSILLPATLFYLIILLPLVRYIRHLESRMEKARTTT